MATRIVYSPEFPEGQIFTLTAEEEAVREALRIESNKKIAAREAAATAKIEADAQLATDKARAR